MDLPLFLALELKCNWPSTLVPTLPQLWPSQVPKNFLVAFGASRVLIIDGAYNWTWWFIGLVVPLFQK